MIHPYEITIGSLLRTSKGEIIRVESISTKRQHRKVGYHTPNDPYRIKYVRLAQCEGIELTPEILQSNGFEHNDYGDWIVNKNDYFIGWSMIRKTIRIIFYSTIECVQQDAFVSCEHIHELQLALRLCGLHELAENLKV